MGEILAPLLTEFDPALSSEGALDPLGLYSIADSLAEKLAPGIRQRQSNPRYLTAIAVASAVCSGFDDDIAKDGVSEPWQVFEWYMVEGLVRSIEDNNEIRGSLPGIDKAKRALRDSLHLSASSYLKTPRVFGFHGVYRVLARRLDLIDQYGHLGEKGFELVTIWTKEQGLEGFYGAGDGTGRYNFQQLVSAVKDGLEEGAVNRSGTWDGWQFFKNYLAPFRYGKKESNYIFKLLVESSDSMRQLINFIVTDEGQNVWIETESERSFHEAFKLYVTDDLQNLLDTILAYEAFARLLQDAFDDCLYTMAKERGKVTPEKISKLPSVKSASERIPDMFAELSDYLQTFGESVRFEESFNSLAERVKPISWVQALLEHHRTVQKNKPPEGKNPWFERFDDGSVVIRPGYRRDEEALHNNSYVHPYRTIPLMSFVQDLGIV